MDNAQPPAPPTGWPVPQPARKSNKIRNTAIIAGAVIGGLLVIGMLTPDGQRGVADGAAAVLPTATPEPTPSPTATPEPTPSPTPTQRPTPRPTRAPTPEPTISADSLDYVEFLGWQAGYGETFVEDIERLGNALEDNNPYLAAVEADNLLEYNQEASRWLKNHPPAACYASAHANMSKAVEHYITAFKAQSRWLWDFPFGKDKDFNTWENQSNKATALIDKATEMTAECGL